MWKDRHLKVSGGQSKAHGILNRLTSTRKMDFQKREKAEELIAYLSQPLPLTCEILSIEKKKEKKNPPLVVQLGRASK